MKTIGLTGGVGSGKSTVLEYLERAYGAVVVQADQVGHLLMEPGQVCYEPVIRLLGKDICREDGSLDRGIIADRVFRDETLLNQLNAIIHPAVRDWILERKGEACRAGAALYVVEAALLLEAGYDEFCDELWVVTSNREVRIRRLMEGRGYTRQKCLDIMASQVPDEVYTSRADVVIDNSGAVEDTIRQIDKRL